MVPTVDGTRPVALHDAVAEGGGGGLVQPAPSLLHQHLTRRLHQVRKEGMTERTNQPFIDFLGTKSHRVKIFQFFLITYLC
jgi:hypothetical protein